MPFPFSRPLPPDFRRLWWAGLVSMTGDWALRIALPIYVLRLTGSPAAVALVVLAGLAASLLFGVVAGALVDRYDRRRVLVVVNLAQGLVLLPLLTVGPGRTWPVTAVAFLEATLAQFIGPAESALLPRLVGPDRLATANAWNSGATYLARLAGPAVGGLVTAGLGLTGASIVDSASFVGAGLLCLRIKGPHRAEPTPRHLGRELVEGARAIAGRRIARAILVFGTLTAVGEGMMLTLFAVFVTRALHAGGRELGWLLCAQAVGGIAGGLAGGRLRRRFRPVPLASVCMALFGLGDLVIFNLARWDIPLWPEVVLFFLIGVPAGVGYPVLLTLFQLQAPDRLRGRVSSVLAAGQAVAGMLGATLAGALGGRIGVVDLLTVQGAGYVGASLLLWALAGPGPAAPGVPTPPPGPALA